MYLPMYHLSLSRPQTVGSPARSCYGVVGRGDGGLDLLGARRAHEDAFARRSCSYSPLLTGDDPGEGHARGPVLGLGGTATRE